MFIRRIWPGNPQLFPAGFPDPARLRRDMDRLFDVFWAETPEESTAGVFPAMNVTQDGTRYYVRAELPGVEPGDLKISVERNKLTVGGERKIATEGEEVSYHRRERVGGQFSRSLTLPDELDTEAVDARYADGILTVTLPKAAAARPRQISVQAN